MPELPDLELYLHALRPRVIGASLNDVMLRSPFLLRSIEPPLTEFRGRKVETLLRLGKRIVFEFEAELFLVLHLMIAGRLRWFDAGKATARSALARFEFSTGTLVLTEAGSKRRASLHAVGTRAALAEHDPGGVEPLEVDFPRFSAALTRENRTLKRALTDPRLFSGIGNAYSDEILHRARLSPFALTQKLDPSARAQLFEAVQSTLTEWRDRLIAESGSTWPQKVTAFRSQMAVHGRYRQPCPSCQQPVQRIVYAENEANYCARCQTGGKLLADRALSQLLKRDWPKTVEELETHYRQRRADAPDDGGGNS
jgi:formamidopyrimidine-DNA glycosylase